MNPDFARIRIRTYSLSRIMKGVKSKRGKRNDPIFKNIYIYDMDPDPGEKNKKDTDSSIQCYLVSEGDPDFKGIRTGI